MSTPFRPGLRLAGEYYAGVVRPLLDTACPGLPYSAALLGAGSEVLGFDTARSTDHDWGPRLQIFLADGDAAAQGGRITALLAGRLPAAFGGYRTAFGRSHEPGGAARHGIEVTGLGRWLAGRLGFDPRGEVTLLDWLATPTQRLAEVTAGRVFHDGLGQLGPARARLAWYPPDVWRYVLACQWRRIGEEEAFPGRCAEVADGLGSAVVTARLARDLMRLGLLMHRRYPPYSKWLGTAFAWLPGAGPLVTALAGAVAATGWPAREQHLVRAYELAARWHNELGLTEPLGTGTRPFFGRPFQVLDAGRFAGALLAGVTDPCVRALAGTGAVDQFVDSTPAAGDITLLRATVAAALRRAG